MKSVKNIIKSVYRFYSEGFRDMSSWGRKAWTIILIKLFVIFVILRIFFFHDFLGSKFRDESHKSDYVRNQLINTHN